MGCFSFLYIFGVQIFLCRLYRTEHLITAYLVHVDAEAGQGDGLFSPAAVSPPRRPLPPPSVDAQSAEEEKF